MHLRSMVKISKKSNRAHLHPKNEQNSKKHGDRLQINGFHRVKKKKGAEPNILAMILRIGKGAEPRGYGKGAGLMVCTVIEQKGAELEQKLEIIDLFGLSCGHELAFRSFGSCSGIGSWFEVMRLVSPCCSIINCMSSIGIL